MHYLLTWLISFRFTLKYTAISLLHVSVFNDHHQGALSVPNESYIYVKTLGKITLSYKLGHVACCDIYIVGDVAACRRVARAALRHAATSPNIYDNIILPSV